LPFVGARRTGIGDLRKLSVAEILEQRDDAKA
jgi:hypothetical protein